MPIYHIAFPADWDAAKSAGSYTFSSKGRTLAEEGFIHASQASQVAWVANRFYSEDDGLILLVIDPDRLVSKVRYEPAPGVDLPFPHIYGPINPDAVTGVLPLERGPDGKFQFAA
ncbi:DUF952 domain-containing protein [Actinospica robiniae]|uniref:DUF952 domain-containing protein n=1 Tax=Actinospica robiniae TaxID=304901 RepID=UPI0003F8F24A|nr:DUF952 domain-containing protein [Actinospica robiniae]